jgi:hypothetical protein
MNKEDFNKFIISEIKKISEKENLNSKIYKNRV